MRVQTRARLAGGEVFVEVNLEARRAEITGYGE